MIFFIISVLVIVIAVILASLKVLPFFVKWIAYGVLLVGTILVCVSGGQYFGTLFANDNAVLGKWIGIVIGALFSTVACAIIFRHGRIIRSILLFMFLALAISLIIMGIYESKVVLPNGFNSSESSLVTAICALLL